MFIYEILFKTEGKNHWTMETVRYKAKSLDLEKQVMLHDLEVNVTRLTNDMLHDLEVNVTRLTDE